MHHLTDCTDNLTKPNNANPGFEYQRKTTIFILPSLSCYIAQRSLVFFFRSQ